MRALPKLLLIATTLLWTAPLAALPKVDGVSPGRSESKPAYFADAKKKRAAPKKSKGMREKYLSGEATMKGKDQTKVDFDAADIGGQRKTPMGTLINQNKADKNYDFVKIRLRWHPEMVQSASSLDSGSGQ